MKTVRILAIIIPSRRAFWAKGTASSKAWKWTCVWYVCGMARTPVRVCHGERGQRSDTDSSEVTSKVGVEAQIRGGLKISGCCLYPILGAVEDLSSGAIQCDLVCNRIHCRGPRAGPGGKLGGPCSRVSKRWWRLRGQHGSVGGCEQSCRPGSVDRAQLPRLSRGLGDDGKRERT